GSLPKGAPLETSRSLPPRPPVLSVLNRKRVAPPPAAAPAFLDDAAEAAEAATVPEEPAVMQAPAVTFEDCREVVLTLDPAMNVHDMRDIADKFKRWPYSGTRLVTLTLRHWVGGASGGYDRYRVGCYKLSEDDLDGLLKRLYRYLDGEEEYL